LISRLKQDDCAQQCGGAWKVTVVDTGLKTQTGGRIKRIRPYVDGEAFMMT
jgi:hypothetical protein